MGRRSTPERINAAHLERVRQRPISTRMSGETADAWLAEWEGLAALDRILPSGGYWDAAQRWIEEQRPRRVRP